MKITKEDKELMDNFIHSFRWQKLYLKRLKENLQFMCKQCVKAGFDKTCPRKKTTIKGIPNYQCDCPVREYLEIISKILNGRAV